MPSALKQIFTLRQISEKSWEYAKDVFTRIVDLEKAYNQATQALKSAAGVWQ